MFQVLFIDFQAILVFKLKNNVEQLECLSSETLKNSSKESKRFHRLFHGSIPGKYGHGTVWYKMHIISRISSSTRFHAENIINLQLWDYDFDLLYFHALHGQAWLGPPRTVWVLSITRKIQWDNFNDCHQYHKDYINCKTILFKVNWTYPNYQIKTILCYRRTSCVAQLCGRSVRNWTWTNNSLTHCFNRDRRLYGVE